MTRPVGADWEETFPADSVQALEDLAAVQEEVVDSVEVVVAVDGPEAVDLEAEAEVGGVPTVQMAAEGFSARR